MAPDADARRAPASVAAALCHAEADSAAILGCLLHLNAVCGKSALSGGGAHSGALGPAAFELRAEERVDGAAARHAGGGSCAGIGGASGAVDAALGLAKMQRSTSETSETRSSSSVPGGGVPATSPLGIACTLACVASVGSARCALRALSLLQTLLVSSGGARAAPGGDVPAGYEVCAALLAGLGALLLDTAAGEHLSLIHI